MIPRRAKATALLAALIGVSGTGVAQATPGDLDPSFGQGGIIGAVNGLAKPEVIARDVAIQPDGKIVAIGERVGSRGAYVRRYNPDGSLDLTFSQDGQVLDRAASRVLLQPDGKIVVAATIGELSGTGKGGVQLTRLNPDGSLDQSFGGDGHATARYIEPEELSAALAPGGKIVVSYQGNTKAAGERLAILRFNADGHLDKSLSHDGKTLYDNDGDGLSHSGVAVQPDGKIVTVSTSLANSSAALIMRYRTGGTLDKSFGHHGVVKTKFGRYGGGASSVVLQPDGKIVVAGPGYRVVRYTTRGRLDKSFSGDGKTTVNLGAGDTGLYASSVALTPVGDVIVGGGGEDGAGIAWLHPNGSLNTGLSGDGRLAFTRYQGSIGSLAIQSDCKVVQAIGYGNHGMILARFEGIPAPAGGCVHGQ